MTMKSTLEIIPAAPTFITGPDVGAWGVYVKKNGKLYAPFHVESLSYMKGNYSSKDYDIRVLNIEHWAERESILKSYGDANNKRYIRIPKGFLTLANHWPRVSDDKKMIRFFASEEHAKVNRLTEMKPGKYVQKYFPAYGPEKYAAMWAEEFEEPVLHITKTADEVEWVYVNGPRSCMSGKVAEVWPNVGVHPTRVYAGQDLAVAYIKKGDRVTARTVCWPEKKTYSDHLYGDAIRLRKALHDAGFSKGSMARAKIAKIPVGHAFVLPYLDFATVVGEEADHLIVSPGGTHKRLFARTAQAVPDGTRTCDITKKFVLKPDALPYTNAEGRSRYVAKEALTQEEKVVSCDAGTGYCHPSQTVVIGKGRRVNRGIACNPAYITNVGGTYYLYRDLRRDPKTGNYTVNDESTQPSGERHASA